MFENYEITLQDMNQNYFHFTSENNLHSIKEKGLIPQIGKNAKFLEITKKVFFVEGLDNLLILFDCWINCYYYIPRIPYIYSLGTLFIRQKWFPTFIADAYFGVLKKTKIHKRRAYKMFDKVLSESVLLKLDLKENIDFKYDDIDEIKSRDYKRKHLELMGYSNRYSSLNNNCMDKWNMHCISNHIIKNDKIKLCYLNNSYKLEDIFNYVIKQTNLKLEDTCPILYDYLFSHYRQ